jgi:hypothetical protein
MKRIVLFVVSLALSGATLRAQTFTQVRNAGPRANRINVVFLAEGYTAAEQTKFQTDAAMLLDVLLNDESWNRFASYINAFTIYVASNESGADDPLANPPVTRDTYFNTSFGRNGIDRLLTISDTAGTNKLFALLTQYLPDYDIIVLLVNSTKYGGAGGLYLTTSLNVSAREIILHELGHSFARLADEYVDSAAAPFYPPTESPNATQKTTRNESPWRDFISFSTPIPTVSAPDENTVGLFLGAEYRDTGFYRPTYNSKMRALGRPFGPVNLRAYATAVHALNLEATAAKPVLVQSPAGGIVAAGQSRSLQVQASGAGPLTYQWRFDRVYLPTGTADSVVIGAMSATQAGVYSVEVTNAAGTTTSADAVLALSGSLVAPAFGVAPASVAASAGQPVSLSVAGGAASYQWQKNGISLAGATSPTFALAAPEPANAGIYAAVLNGGPATSALAVLGFVASGKIAGTVQINREDIPHPNGNIYDQMLLDGPAATVRASASKVVRTSFVDPTNDIVQVEFSGAGALTITLEGATGPAPAANYVQPDIAYMKGLASIVIVGADETTNLSVFSVGRGTAINQALFRDDVSYDGVADLGSIAIVSTDGKFGGVRTGDATFFNDHGFTGIYAPGVQFLGPVYVGNISASGTATPLLVVGGVSDLRVTGGDLQPTNGHALQVAGFTQLRLTDGTDSHNRVESKQPLHTRFERDGVDVTSQVTVTN